MKKVNVAVIGIGRMGGRHAFNIYHNFARDMKLVAVCDIDTKKLEKYRKSDVKTYTDYKEMLESGEVEAVIIATQHYFHGEIAKYALSKGIHTLVEKPLTVYTKEAKEVFKEKKENTVFMSMYNQRTNKIHKKAKQIIDSGKLGKLIRANWIITNWYRSQSYYNQGGWRASWSGEGGGALINQCIHQLDLLQWLIGMPTSLRAFCNTVNRNITVENDATIYMKYGKDASAVFIASTHDIPGTNRLEITFDKGRLIITKRKLIFDTLAKSESEVNNSTISGLYGTTIKFRKTYHYFFISYIIELLLGEQIRVIRNFAKSIKGKEKPIAYGEESINAISLLNGAYLSNGKNKEISLPIDDEEYYNYLKEEIKKENNKIN